MMAKFTTKDCFAECSGFFCHEDFTNFLFVPLRADKSE